MSPTTVNTDTTTLVAMVIDIVESSRLYEADAPDAIARWRALLAFIRESTLGSSGRVVRSTGDGVLLSFAQVPDSVEAALDIQARSCTLNAKLAPERQLLLRIALDVGEFVVDEHDIFGKGAMLATRLLSVAGPGEVVVTPAIRDQVIDHLQADVEDLGDCYLKHISAPVRVYRLGTPGPLPRVAAGFSLGDMRPTVAVIPPLPLGAAGAPGADGSAVPDVLGEVIAEETIRALSRSTELGAISRLSTRAMRGRAEDLAVVARYLGANYALTGRYFEQASGFSLSVELADCTSARVLWSERLSGTMAELLSESQPLIHALVAGIASAVAANERQIARNTPLPNLRSYTLLFGAISLMHRLSPGDFARSRELLDELLGRATRNALPRAWLANWHVLKVQQGWSDAPAADGERALEYTRQALDDDPESSLALSIDGFVNTNLLRRLDVAADRYELALDINPNEAMAWLLKGTLHAFKGEGAEAVSNTQRALALAPLDPRRYFYESLAATACLADHRYGEAAELATSSLRANRTHTSTLRVLAAAQWQLGDHDAARGTAKLLQDQEPGITVSGWLARSPAADFPIGAEWARVLRDVGIPG